MLWTVALKRATFKQKKGRATISLGLFLYSTASSQPPSRDIVPLKTVLRTLRHKKANFQIDFLLTRH
jgi:hypothetical protein